MNKSDLIEALSLKNSLTNKQAAQLVRLMFNGFTKTLKHGGRIEIRGFGSFCVRRYKAFKGRNPKSGNRFDVKPKRMPYFKVGRELKARVNGPQRPQERKATFLQAHE